jgi:hypothetical protein
MPIAADYPFLEVLWSILIFTALVIWIWTAIAVLGDVFRRDDIGGWHKAAWVVGVVVFPFLGVIAYLIANHEGMTERGLRQAEAQRAEFDSYVRDVAGANGATSEIERANRLRESGAISQAEFDQIKQRALA